MAVWGPFLSRPAHSPALWPLGAAEAGSPGAQEAAAGRCGDISLSVGIGVRGEGPPLKIAVFSGRGHGGGTTLRCFLSIWALVSASETGKGLGSGGDRAPSVGRVLVQGLAAGGSGDGLAGLTGVWEQRLGPEESLGDGEAGGAGVGAPR